jgi:GntR family transcriptional regulator / MocR family aminotransferase
MYKFEKNTIPLYIQLYEQMKEDIKINLLAGSKLPSIRKMVDEYNLSKNTIQSAYNQLYAEGYIESKAKSGYFVCEDIYQKFEKDADEEFDKESKNKDFKINFYPASLSKSSFPKKTWLKLYSKVLKSDIHYGIYQNKQGDEGLRQEIQKYLFSSRAVNCSKEQIIITSGFSDSMFIVGSILKTISNSFAIEYPAYSVARKVLELLSYDIKDISVNSNGIDINQLEETACKSIYLTPSHQFPTGVTIPIANRIKLIHWAKKNDSFIIEDDYDSELSYYNRPIPSMQGLENSDRVVYVGTFSKALSPALRVAYIVLPTKLLPIYKSAFDFSFSGVPIDLQKTLELFLKDGYWEKHLRKIRNLNRKKHEIMKNSLLHYLKDEVKILREGSGLSFLIKPLINIDLAQLEEIAEKRGVKIYFKEYFEIKKVLALGFGAFEENEIENAIKTFYEIWQEAKSSK